MKAALIIMAGLFMGLTLLSGSTPTNAATPTPIPSVTPGGRTYNRSELLTQMAPIAVPATAAFQSLQLPQVSVDTIAGGIGIGKTMENMLSAAGVFSFILGILLLMFVIYWVRKQLTGLGGKGQVSPYQKEIKQFRKEFKAFRGSYRAKRRR